MEFEKLRDILVETLGCDADKVTPEANMIDDLEADSLDVMELMMALEEAFDVTIDDADVAELKTVGDVANYITAHMQ